MDSLCNTIEFHGKDTREIYPNEFTMCFKNVWYRDPYCALSIKVLEGNKDALSKYVSSYITFISIILVIQIKFNQIDMSKVLLDHRYIKTSDINTKKIIFKDGQVFFFPKYKYHITRSINNEKSESVCLLYCSNDIFHYCRYSH